MLLFVTLSNHGTWEPLRCGIRLAGSSTYAGRCIMTQKCYASCVDTRNLKLGEASFGKCQSGLTSLYGASCHSTKPLGASSPGGPEFAEFKETTQASHGVEFLSSMADLPAKPDDVNRLALVSGRTADNPKFLKECIDAKCSTIYLEKPGAPTVAELEQMRDQAKAANVTVLMGYNKNVTKYVQKALDYQKENGGTIIFVSNNAYESTPDSLGECFERNKEGMLKNMAIHELALLVSFFDVTVENIESCVADADFTHHQTLKGPSGKDFTDFDKIKITVKTKTGKEVSVAADRCGGETSWALVEKDGQEVFRHTMPDSEDKELVKTLEEKYPGAMVR